jgi:hypothetical protein
MVSPTLSPTWTRRVSEFTGANSFRVRASSDDLLVPSFQCGGPNLDDYFAVICSGLGNCSYRGGVPSLATQRRISALTPKGFLLQAATQPVH